MAITKGDLAAVLLPWPSEHKYQIEHTFKRKATLEEQQIRVVVSNEHADHKDSKNLLFIRTHMVNPEPRHRT